MKTIWIIGTGRFGMIALHRLEAKKTADRFVLVDPEEAHFEQLEGPGRVLEKADGPDYLLRRMGPRTPQWIIPALPIHLAAEWCLRRLGPDRLRRCRPPDSLLSMLPNAVLGETGDVYVSHAAFLCPDNCSEPRNICTVTGEPRKPPLFELIRRLSLDGYTPVPVRSHQLGPGVGGYRPKQLFDMLEAVETGGRRLLLATACKCHGVVTPLRKIDG